MKATSKALLALLTAAAALSLLGCSSSDNSSGVATSGVEAPIVTCWTAAGSIKAGASVPVEIFGNVVRQGLPASSITLRFEAELGLIGPNLAVTGVDGTARSLYHPPDQPGTDTVTVSFPAAAGAVEGTCAVEVEP